MGVFKGWLVDGKLQKEPPKEFMERLVKAFEETCNVKITHKEQAG